MQLPMRRATGGAEREGRVCAGRTTCSMAVQPGMSLPWALSALRRGGAVGLAAACLAGAAPAVARASATHVVQPGETLSGIASANGLTTEALAAWNGISSDSPVVSGSSLAVPTPEEAGVDGTASATTAADSAHVVAAGESLGSIAASSGVSVADLAAANGMAEADILPVGATLQVPAASTAGAPAPTPPAPGLGAIPSPWGDLYLDPAAAESWNAMRERSLSDYGQDLYPAGPLSAYRTSAQQGELYESYLSGVGDPANPPGYSSHELGVSVDLATPEMRWVVDQIGAEYGWGKLEAPDEWWHVTYGG